MGKKFRSLHEKAIPVGDRITRMKAEYEKEGPARSNMRYG
jgi:hypothetical protein